jgi:uncharacterized protein YdeI (YjbR/CyaY-like superfamily)
MESGDESMEPLLFINQTAFRAWLMVHAKTHEGIWLVFGKANGPQTLSPDEALHEALCFGWIDGMIKKIDDVTYMKYFAKRRKGSVWSARNKGFVDMLEKQGKMTDLGKEQIMHAKQNGEWDNPLEPITHEHVMMLIDALGDAEPAKTNLLAMSFSIQKTYAGYYLSAKQESTKIKRIQSIISRLNQNLRPM